MRAALDRVDVVCEREHRLLVGGVPLHRDLDRAFVALALEGDDLFLDRLLVAVQVCNEVDDPAVVLELRAVPLASLVDERDLQPAGEEGGVTHPLLERGEVEVQRLEHVGVGKERDRGASLLRRLALLEVVQRLAALVGLDPVEAVALDIDVESLRQCVHDRHADAVKTPGDLVAAPISKLAARVQHGEYDLDRRTLLLGHHRDRDPAPVIGNRHRAVGVDRD